MFLNRIQLKNVHLVDVSETGLRFITGTVVSDEAHEYNPGEFVLSCEVVKTYGNFFLALDALYEVKGIQGCFTVASKTFHLIKRGMQPADALKLVEPAYN